MALAKFTWENGTQIEPAKVEIGGQSYNVSDAQYEGETPLSASNLNLMQDTILGNVKDDLTDDTKIPSIKAIKSTYSATEKIIGTWVDNKPIYRKVFMFGAMPNATLKTITHNITNLDKTIRLYGMAFRSDTKRTLTIPDSTPGGEITCNITNTEINITTVIDRSSFNDSYIIVEYTKTTDV